MTEIQSMDDAKVAAEVAVTEDNFGTALSEVLEKKRVYSSMSQGSQTERVAVVRAVANAEKVRDAKGKLDNKVIALKHFVVQPVEIENENTGEIELAPRVILVDASGASFATVSRGVLSSLELLVSVVGEPSTWDEPVSVTLDEEMTRKGYRVTTLKF